MTDILLTNDDGYRSALFYSLHRALSERFKVFSITPAVEMSWVGKAISAKSELTLKSVESFELQQQTLTGTPADCVQVGLYHLLQTPPAMVVSGINIGENTGHGRILSSGTVGACMEAAIAGIKALCASIQVPPDMREKIDFFEHKNHYIFENHAKIVEKLVGILIKKDFPKGVDIFSVNMPFDADLDTKLELTKPFKASYGSLFERHGSIFRLKMLHLFSTDIDQGTDIYAIKNGHISVSPIDLSLVSGTHFKEIEESLELEW
jgi:5'-nucleotidase